MLLANYVPKCQMSSGPCGPIFIVMLGKLALNSKNDCNSDEQSFAPCISPSEVQGEVSSSKNSQNFLKI